MIKSYGRWVAMILFLWVVGGVPDGMFAPSHAQTQDPASPGIRETKIQETELLDSSSPDPAEKELEGSPTVLNRKSERPANFAAQTPDAERPEMAEDAVRSTAATRAGALPLLARITAKTPPQRAASLKLVDEGQKAMEMGEYKQALATFESSIAVDATNPYSHYFMARAHFFLKNYRESFNFLDVAESLLGWHKLWLAEIYVLKGHNAAAMGFLGRADTNYLQALGFDPYNSIAFQRLTNIHTIRAGAELPAP